MTVDATDSSLRIARCDLNVAAAPWAFAQQHEAEIAAHWRRVSAERPMLFDGTVHLLREGKLDGDDFRGTFVRTDFKSFLFWRDTGYADAGTRDSFGSAVIRSAEGHVLLGRQAQGNLNAGLAYPPGGFIDAGDVSAQGHIDIDASIARELAEETGLDPVELDRAPGYLLTQAGPLVSIGIEWRSRLPAEALRERILAHVHSQHESELADVLIVRTAAEIDEGAIPRYARALLRALLTA